MIYYTTEINICYSKKVLLYEFKTVIIFSKIIVRHEYLLKTLGFYNRKTSTIIFLRYIKPIVLEKIFHFVLFNLTLRYFISFSILLKDAARFAWIKHSLRYTSSLKFRDIYKSTRRDSIYWIFCHHKTSCIILRWTRDLTVCVNN